MYIHLNLIPHMNLYMNYIFYYVFIIFTLCMKLSLFIVRIAEIAVV